MRCPSCGFESVPHVKFCGECGRRLADGGAARELRFPRAYTPRHLAEKILTSRSALQGERKHVTVLFADVKGSMELASRVDPEDWHSILDRFFDILAGGVHRFEGTINQYTGDGVMALFGAPIAHEDHAQRACYAALDLRAELRRYADEVRLAHELNFSVRIGLNSGDVVVGRIGDDLRMDYTAQGHTVGLAARIEQLAEPGRIYLTQHTAKLVRGYVEMRSLGALNVKGVPEPIEVFELESAAKLWTRLEVSRERGFTRFVGRTGEIELLDSALESAIGGRGRIVAVVGEPGVGKSRLCLEFAERSRQRGVGVFEAHCPAHGKGLSYLPILQLFRAIFGISERDTADQARRKIAGSLLLLDAGFRDDLALIFDFLGIPDAELALARMDPEARQRRLVDVTRRLMAARSRREAAILVVDDLHWIDPESDAFLAGILDAVAETRTVLLVNFRPDYDAPWIARPDCLAIPVRPLAARDVEELLDALVGGDDSLRPLREVVAERSAGNPFFAEELVQSLVDSGHLAGGKGGYRLLAPLDRISLPPTVESVLAARIDRAGEPEKAVLQAAAVIGREFSEPILERVADLPVPVLRGSLALLLRAGLIVERAPYPRPEYAFKHPLVQEVAYRSQLARNRARLHAAVARALAALLPDGAGDNAALLAQHWEAAGEALEAARSHRGAARWIGPRDAGAAVRHWRRIRELLREAPESDETLRLRALACHRILSIGWRTFIGKEEADGAFAEGRELAERLHDRAALVRLLDAHATFKTFFGEDFGELFTRTAEALKLAEEAGDLGLLVALHGRMAWAHILRADPRAGLEVADRGIALARGDMELGRDEAGYSPLSGLHTFRGFFLLFSGRVVEGGAAIERAIELARQSGDEDSVQFPLGQLAAYAYFFGDASSVLPRVREAVDIAARIGNRWGLVMAYDCLAHAYLVAEDWRRALLALEEQERRMGAVEDAYGRTWLLQGRAEAHLGLGDAAEALRLVEPVVRLARERRWPYPECKALLTLSRALRGAKGRAAAGEIETALSRLAAIVDETGMTGFGPFLEVERAELAGLTGDAAGRRAKLEEARRLFAAMGASGHAERIATRLGPFGDDR